MTPTCESQFDPQVERKSAFPRNIVILLLILTATILVSALPGSAFASAGVSQTRSTGYVHLLLFSTSSLHKPLG